MFSQLLDYFSWKQVMDDRPLRETEVRWFLIHSLHYISAFYGRHSEYDQLFKVSNKLEVHNTHEHFHSIDVIPLLIYST